MGSLTPAGSVSGWLRLSQWSGREGDVDFEAACGLRAGGDRCVVGVPNQLWHRYDLIGPSNDVLVLLDEVDRDPSAISGADRRQVIAGAGCSILRDPPRQRRKVLLAEGADVLLVLGVGEELGVCLDHPVDDG